MSSKSEPIKISGQPTLDPTVCKFTIDYPLYPDGSFTCRDKDSAKGSPLLEALFEIEGIREIMVADQTLTIAKTGDQAWPEMGKKIGAVVREQITAGKYKRSVTYCLQTTTAANYQEDPTSWQLKPEKSCKQVLEIADKIR